MSSAEPPLVTFYVIHIFRGVRRVWTKPEALTRDAAFAYAESFNNSLRAKTHTETAVVVRQQAAAALPRPDSGPFRAGR